MTSSVVDANCLRGDLNVLLKEFESSINSDLTTEVSVLPESLKSLESSVSSGCARLSERILRELIRSSWFTNCMCMTQHCD